VLFQGGSNALGTGLRRSSADYNGALTAQFQSNSLANTTAGTCYQCNFTLQAHAGFS